MPEFILDRVVFYPEAVNQGKGDPSVVEMPVPAEILAVCAGVLRSVIASELEAIGHVVRRTEDILEGAGDRRHHLMPTIRKAGEEARSRARTHDPAARLPSVVGLLPSGALRPSVQILEVPEGH